MPNAVLFGDSNNGKTSIIDRLEKTSGEPYRNGDGESVFPLIVAEAPGGANVKDLYLAIMENFADPHRTTDTANKLHYQTLHLFRQCNVRLLVIDEFHNLMNGSAIKQRETMDGLKRLCNSARVPIVGVGTPKALRVISRDDQYASRFVAWKLPSWKPNREFQTLLGSFEAMLPLKEPSNLPEATLARKLHAACGGNLGNLHALLIRCAEEAIDTGQERIDEQLVERHTWTKVGRMLELEV